jgi:hypothetical protein
MPPDLDEVVQSFKDAAKFFKTATSDFKKLTDEFEKSLSGIAAAALTIKGIETAGQLYEGKGILGAIFAAGAAQRAFTADLIKTRSALVAVGEAEVDTAAKLVDYRIANVALVATNEELIKTENALAATFGRLDIVTAGNINKFRDLFLITERLSKSEKLPELLGLQTKSLNMTTAGTIGLTREFVALERQLGLTPGKILDTAVAQKDLIATFGDVGVFKRNAAALDDYARQLDTTADKLAGFADKFGTMPDALRTGAQINRILANLGGRAIDPMELLGADPETITKTIIGRISDPAVRERFLGITGRARNLLLAGISTVIPLSKTQIQTAITRGLKGIDTAVDAAAGIARPRGPAAITTGPRTLEDLAALTIKPIDRFTNANEVLAMKISRHTLNQRTQFNILTTNIEGGITKMASSVKNFSEAGAESMGIIAGVLRELEKGGRMDEGVRDEITSMRRQVEKAEAKLRSHAHDRSSGAPTG